MFSYNDFIAGAPLVQGNFKFVSLFSGAGIGDFGLKLAGGSCIAACEIDSHRSAVHRHNISAPVWGNLRTEKQKLIASVGAVTPDLLIATPPCQSFSTANARRGLIEDPEHATRDDRNTLFFEALEVARALRPKIIFFENVPNFLKRKIHSQDRKLIGKVEEFLRASLSEYVGWCDVVCFSTLGVPQRRKRSMAIFIRRDILSGRDFDLALPINWPGSPKSTPKTILEALNNLPVLDSICTEKSSSPEDPLHCVPIYLEKHYDWISSIPAGSGQSAWENACKHCGDSTTPVFSVICSKCGKSMKNRPHVTEAGGNIRPIRGFKTSYKRMLPNEPAPTITTASGSFSSDLKLHPNQNRVLSARECALLQTIPYNFEWPKAQQFKKGHLVREMVGEAVPPLVTYRLGLAVARIISAVS